MARYKIKTWNGKYGNNARFIVQENSSGKYAEFQPTRPKDVAWVKDDLTKQEEYKGWESFQDEPLDSLEGVVFQGKEMNAYIEAFEIAVLLSNDLKHVHFHSFGEDFDKTHDLTSSYYKLVDEDVDTLAEIALEVGEEIPNPTNARVEGWKAEDQEKYEYGEALTLIKRKLAVYLNALEALRSETPYEDVKSRLDEILGTWKKELNYKLKRRSGVAVNTFVPSAIDGRTVQYAKSYFSGEEDE